MIAVDVAPSAEEAARRTAERLARAVTAALEARGRAHVALAGGHTPRQAYAALGPLVPAWDAVELWFGDERAVGPDDPDSNDRLVRESLLASIAGPPPTVHRIAGELGAPAAAGHYAEALATGLPRDAAGVPRLDVALLGVGEDGHTASLFPGDPLLREPGPPYARAVTAPKPPPSRVTVTLDVLLAAGTVLLLAVGPGKREALDRVLAGPDPAAPASLLGAHGDATLLCDAAAR